MSAIEVVEDVLAGNFENAEARMSDWWHGTLQPELKALVLKFASDSGKIVWAAGTTALVSVAGGQTVSEAAAIAWATIESQVPGMAITDLEDAIGIQKRAS
jgi:hypothetical protein